MAFDPRLKPSYLSFERDRTNPNRLKTGVLSVADHNENQVPVVPRPPSLIEQALKYGKLVAIALVAISGALLGLQVEGLIALPPALLGILTAVSGIGAALGIASGGLKKSDAGPLKDLPPE